MQLGCWKGLVLTPIPHPVVAWGTDRMSQAGTRLTILRPRKGSGPQGSVSGLGWLQWHGPALHRDLGAAAPGRAPWLQLVLELHLWAWSLLGSPGLPEGHLGLGCEEEAVGFCVPLFALNVGSLVLNLKSLSLDQGPKCEALEEGDIGGSLGTSGLRNLSAGACRGLLGQSQPRGRRVCVLRAQAADGGARCPTEAWAGAGGSGFRKDRVGRGWGWHWLEGHAGPGKPWLQGFLPSLPHPNLTSLHPSVHLLAPPSSSSSLPLPAPSPFPWTVP